MESAPTSPFPSAAAIFKKDHESDVHSNSGGMVPGFEEDYVLISSPSPIPSPSDSPPESYPQASINWLVSYSSNTLSHKPRL